MAQHQTPREARRVRAQSKQTRNVAIGVGVLVVVLLGVLWYLNQAPKTQTAQAGTPSAPSEQATQPQRPCRGRRSTASSMPPRRP